MLIKEEVNQLSNEILTIRTQLEFPLDLDDTSWFSRAQSALIMKRRRWFEIHRDNNLPYVFI